MLEAMLLHVNANIGSWKRRADLIKGVMLQTGGVVNGKLYFYGGYVSPGTASQELWVYDPTVNIWSKIADVGRFRQSQACAVVNNKLYFHGGLDENRYGKTDLWVYDPATNLWTQKASSPNTHDSHVAVGVDNAFYIYGGNGLGKFLKYEAISDTWSEMAKPITNTVNLRYSAGAAINGEIYIYGGNITHSRILVRYNPTTNSWTRLPDIPVSGRREHIAVNLQNKLYVHGGIDASNSTVRTDPWIYDPVTQTWKAQPSSPVSRSSHFGGVIDNKVLFTGGSGGDGRIETWEYTP